MTYIEPGTPVVAAPWNDGVLPAAPFALHRWSHRESTGLGVTICGMRQEDRGNGWVLLTHAHNPPTSMCSRCDTNRDTIGSLT